MSKLQALCDRLRIKCVATYGGELPGGWPAGTHPWKVKLSYAKRSLTVSFYQGPAHTKEPTAADVLSCICLDTRSGELDFDEFCDELGFDRDSRKAEKTWKACEKLAPRVRHFLGDDFDEISEAEH